MKILITGCCGFIGFNFAMLQLQKKIKIIGIDNLNNYYSVKLKKERLKKLKKFKNFEFNKKDLTNKLFVKNLFKKHKFDYVFHFAAQAGVRYSINHPSKYIDANVNGYFNIIDNCKNFKVKKFFYASSSSVYGDSKKFPLTEKDNLNPKNIYGLTKKFNEEIAENYSFYYNCKTIGLRFFTVYGSWGRPDMSIMKYIMANFSKETYYLNNYGNHYRDFTHVSDVVGMMDKLISTKQKNNFEVYNICSSKPIKLTKVINILSNLLKDKTKVIPRKFQLADVLKTHGNNRKIRYATGHKKFKSIENGLIETVNWFKKNRNIF